MQACILALCGMPESGWSECSETLSSATLGFTPGFKALLN